MKKYLSNYLEKYSSKLPHFYRRHRGALSVAVVFAVIEVSLRLGFGLGRPLLYQADSAAGYIVSPNQDIRRFFSHIHIDQFGMRDYDPLRVDGRKILFLGDSVTFGPTYIDQDDTFASITGKALKASVVNASASGWAPGNEVAFLRSRGTFGASTVVMVINTNDLAQKFEPLPNLPIFPVARPVLAVEELMTRYVIPKIRKNVALIDPGAEMNELLPDDAVLAENISYIAAARSFATEQGAQFHLILIPTFSNTVEGKREKGWKNIKEKFLKYVKDSQMPFTDMTLYLEENIPLFYQKDRVHLTEMGHKRVAEVLEEIL